MRLLKWLFQPAYLLLFIVLVALYVNRELVFPEEVVESLEAEALVARVEGLADKLRSDSGEQNAAKGEADTVDEAVADDREATDKGGQAQASVMATVEPQGAEVVQVEEVTQGDEADAAAESATTTPDTPLPAQEVVATAAEADAELVPLPEPVLAQNAAEQAGAASPAEEPASQPPADTDSMVVEQAADTGGELSALGAWKAARTAVWQGDLEGAVRHYRDLITAQPDNYDAYGEMGNVLLAQSQPQAAADAYASAARLIYRSGNRQMAYRVAGIVSELDREQGAALYDEFSR